MDEHRWQPILPHLQEFERYLAPDIPSLGIEPASDRQWTDEQYRAHRKTGVFSKYGVYLIFAPDESLEYVGVAMNDFDSRIWSHDAYVNRRWTDVISFAHEFYFLAISLEFYLIARLQPPKNTTYREYTIPPYPTDAADDA